MEEMLRVLKEGLQSVEPQEANKEEDDEVDDQKVNKILADCMLALILCHNVTPVTTIEDGKQVRSF